MQLLLALLIRAGSGVSSAGGTDALADQVANILFPTRKATDFLKAIPVITLAFSCQFNVPPIFSELQEKSLEKMDSIIFRASMAWCFIYITIGIAGTLAFPETSSWPDGVSSDILTGFQSDDHLIFVARLFMFVVSCFTTPLLALPLRSIVHSLIKVLFNSDASQHGCRRLHPCRCLYSPQPD